MADMMKMMGRGKGGMMGKMASMFGIGPGTDPMAGMDLSKLTPQQLDIIKQQLGGQLPPGFPGAAPPSDDAARKPAIPAMPPPGLFGAAQGPGLPGLGGKLPGLGGLPGLPGRFNTFGGKKK